MFVYRLLWPVLEYAFRDPKAPSWFQRRVRGQFLSIVPRGGLPPSSVVWSLGICGIFLLVPTVLASGSVRNMRGAFSIVCLGLMALLLLAPQVVEGWRVASKGRVAYDQARQDALAALTGHERLDYEDHTVRGKGR